MATLNIGQQIYNFLIVQNWLELFLGIGLTVLSFFFGSITFLISLYMGIKAVLLVLGDYLKEKVGLPVPASRYTKGSRSTIDLLANRKYVVFANTAMIAFAFLVLINIPFIGDLLTKIPFFKNILLIIVLIASTPINPFITIVSLFVKSTLFDTLKPLELSVSELPVFFLNFKDYQSLLFEAVKFDMSLFSSIGSTLLSGILSAILAQNSSLSGQIGPIISDLTNPTKFQNLITNFTEIPGILSDLQSGESTKITNALALLTALLSI
ncbi:hypothetical protein YASMINEVIRUS_75 [Yasminevirus sp. GU-2018]|uniref:Uncharacterized protein n=1 Tax=Yasminevirus sp. GU-2018 TaxID=2420051 RepID=A0A5K0U899_9VIRU|nr:hypothetical protein YASMINEVIRUS_75 [Yasminevirus sp. GU-2018]